MGLKLIWTGLVVMLALSKFLAIPAGEVVGSLLMVIGLVLYLFNK